MKILREILEENMSQVRKMEQSRIAKVLEGLRLFSLALSVNEDVVIDSEEVVKQSGIRELISNERIKNIESMFEEYGTTIKQVKAKLKGQERNNASEIKNSIIKTNIQEIKEEDLER